jgi:hypothetical protein
VGTGKAAIRAALDAYVAGFHQGDLALLVGLWTERGERATCSGEPWVGRQQLQVQFAKYFATVKDVKLGLVSTAIGLRSPCVADDC